MINTYLNFGGFYCSKHEGFIDQMLENYFYEEDQDGNEIEIDISDKNVNYPLIFETHTKDYISNFTEWLRDEFELDINIKFISLISPRFYNFKTDKAEINLTEKDFKKLIKSETSEAAAHIQGHSSSRDGFISFYNGYSEVIKDKSVHAQYLLDYYIELFNDEAIYNYYDQNNSYEMLNELDVELKEGA